MKFKTFISMLGIMPILVILFHAPVFSQVNITVEQVKETMSQGEQTGFQIVIPQASLEDVKKAWTKQIEQGGKIKSEEVGYEIHVHGANAPDISPNPVDIYTLITDVDSSIHLVAFIVIDSAFFDPGTYPDKLVGDKIFNGVQNYMRRFAVAQYEMAVEDELKMEENRLKDLNKQLDDLKKEQEKMEKSTKEEEQNITKADDEIKILNGQKAQQLQSIEEKRISSSTITDKEAKKAANDELKTLEKERNKSDKEIEKMEKNKVSSTNIINDNEKAIEKNKEEQETLYEQIRQQEDVISQVEQKLNGIK